MSRNYFLLIVLPFCLCTALQAQFSKAIGDPYPFVKSIEGFYFHEGHEILSVKSTKKGVLLQKFDTRLLKEVSHRAEEDFAPGFHFEKVMHLGNRYVLFYSLINKKYRNEQLLYREIDFASGTFKGDAVSFITTDDLLTPEGFIFNLSNDHSKLLVTYKRKPFTKNTFGNYDVIGSYVFTSGLEPVWHGECTMPHTEKKMDHLDYSVDGDGNAYLLTSVYHDNTTDAFKENATDVNYHIEIFTLKPGGKDWHKTNVLLDEKLLHKIWIVESPGNYMLCAGIYSTRKSLTSVDGFCTFKLSRTGEIIEIRNYDIPADLFKPQSEEVGESNEKIRAELHHWTMDHLKVEADGSVTMAGEIYYVETVKHYDSKGRTSTHYVYHHDDIVVARINNKSELQWMRRLHKRQSYESLRHTHASYKYGSTFDHEYFVYLDTEHGTKDHLTLYRINKHSGEVLKKQLLSLHEVHGKDASHFSPSGICLINDHELVVEIARNKREAMLVHVRFPEEAAR